MIEAGQNPVYEAILEWKSLNAIWVNRARAGGQCRDTTRRIRRAHSIRIVGLEAGTSTFLPSHADGIATKTRRASTGWLKSSAEFPRRALPKERP